MAVKIPDFCNLFFDCFSRYLSKRKNPTLSLDDSMETMYNLHSKSNLKCKWGGHCLDRQSCRRFDGVPVDG